MSIQERPLLATFAILTFIASSDVRFPALGALSHSGVGGRGNRRTQRFVGHTSASAAWHITVRSRRRSTVGSSWRGRMMLFSVEIRCGAEDLVAVMSRMREWLDAQRFEPGGSGTRRRGTASRSGCNSRPKARLSRAQAPSTAPWFKPPMRPWPPPSPRPKITDPYSIGAVDNRHLRIPVAKVAVEDASFIVPAYTVTHAPLRHHGGGWWPGASGALLARSAGFAPWEAGCAGHGSSLKGFVAEIGASQCSLNRRRLRRWTCTPASRWSSPLWCAQHRLADRATATKATVELETLD
jgi:hypothetical protein